MNYLTGYDGWSFYVHQGLVVALEGEPLWFGREQDSNGARLTTWLKGESILGYADHHVQSQIHHPMDFVAGLLKERGWENRRLGVEMDSYYFTGRCLDRLRENLPGAEIADGDLLVNWIRAIKSEPELAWMEMAARIVERVMAVAVETISPGVREGDAAAAVLRAQTSGTEEFSGDYPAIMPIMPSGVRTTTAHLSWIDRRYEAGDLVLLELAGCKNRYHAPLSRTLIIGPPDPELEEMSRVVIEGLNQTMDFIRPGIRAEEVEERWREAIAGSRVVKESRIGYSYGLNYPPDWGEHTISLRPGDKTVLRPGMTLHLMPGIWTDRFGFECSEPIRITEDGCRPFVDFERRLFIK
jgi:Xaa-Pro dipeptidase